MKIMDRNRKFSIRLAKTEKYPHWDLACGTNYIIFLFFFFFFLFPEGYNKPDPCKARAPAFSFGTRRFRCADNSSPGPQYFIPPNITERGKDVSPAYAICGRPKSCSTFQTPGPACYTPECSVRSTYTSVPSYSMGARTRMSGRDQTPGPAAYKLPSVLGPNVVNKSSSPNYTMTGRSRIGSFHDNLQNTPGPAAYRVVDPTTYKYRSPQYSIGARLTMPGNKTPNPGPGAYKAEKVDVTLPKAPNFSFGIRHSPHAVSLIVDMKG
ncbi:outer dense fiber protein 3-like [Spea bombifrons]|uniref:outer dense fiber protein 3-like n=1 Tax=Spea bombifrons TaxID=233779 RepID=UPI00234B54B7|nr:outer dense fiber protein 3-like [Spea bombifrons]